MGCEAVEGLSSFCFPVYLCLFFVSFCICFSFYACYALIQWCGFVLAWSFLSGCWVGLL